jgi:hypothetical protein
VHDVETVEKALNRADISVDVSPANPTRLPWKLIALRDQAPRKNDGLIRIKQRSP